MHFAAIMHVPCREMLDRREVHDQHLRGAGGAPS
jgi:hypothetical protein